jgi:hypothetical protein
MLVDVQTLIPNVSLAPDLILDTTIDLSSESMTIGDLVDQKTPVSRRVVMDVLVSDLLCTRCISIIPF